MDSNKSKKIYKKVIESLVIKLVITMVFNIIAHYDPNILLHMVHHYLVSRYVNNAFLNWKWYPRAVHFQEKADMISSEITSLLRANLNIPAFEYVDPSQKNLGVGHKWKVFMIQIHGNMVNGNVQLTPGILETMLRVQTWNVFVAIFEPGCVVPLHNGPCKGLLTYHLPIQVPFSDKCYMIVKQGENNYKYKWIEDQGVLYDDFYPNTIVNESPDRLVLLYVNVKRNMKDSLDQYINNFSLGLMSKHQSVIDACKRAFIGK